MSFDLGVWYHLRPRRFMHELEFSGLLGLFFFAVFMVRW
jgi:hypothetical protein